MEVKPGYKQTEVGVIPEEWGVKRLGELFDVGSSKRVFQSEWQTHGVPFYRARELAVLGESGVVDDDLFITREMYEDFKRTYGVPSVGDMLVTGVGTLGKVYVVRPDHEFYFKDGNIIWFKIAGSVSSEFLRQLYLTPVIKKQIGDGSAGTTVGTYTISGAKKTAIPFPPPPEQRAIATALNDMDGLLGGLDRLIAKKRDLKQAAMQQLLTGQTRLPGFHGEWEVKTFAAVLLRLNAKAHQIQTSVYQSSGRYPVVDQGQEAVIGFSDKEEKRLRCPEGGVIVFGDHTCIVKFIDFDFLVGADGTQILQGKTGQSTRFHCLQLQYQGVESTGYNRHFKFLKEREFVTPPLPEQTAIAEVLTEMDGELAVLEQRREKTRALKQAMMQELLTGRTRLV